MDIIIKSFNRPIYLDKCLYSIYKYVEGNFIIKILDDGTPEQYLQKIQGKYPEVQIIKSENYENKLIAINKNINTGEDINGFQIPTDLWIDTVKNASDYFIITEDDVWFINPVNIDLLEKDMTKENISLLKLGWMQNNKGNKEMKERELNGNIISQKPKLFTAPKFIMNLFFYNRFKIFSLLFRLGFVDHYTLVKYWSINSILMGLYRKEYWLKIWEGMNGEVDEKRQLFNAATYYHSKKNDKNFVCRLKIEAMKTTFSSSATNSYHKYKDINLDINRVNHILNEKWYNDEFNIEENFPKDYSEEYISGFLEEENNPKASPQEWKKWVGLFKKQYLDIGCEIE